jgi:hypothetical protein
MKGESRGSLKKLSHDLHKILKKCKELGVLGYVPITDIHENALEILNTWYARKGFEYFELQNLVDNHKSLPPIVEVLGLARLCIEKLKTLCLESVNPTV